MPQENAEDDVDRFVTAQMESQHISGRSLTVFRESLLPKVTWERMWTPATLTDGTKVDYGFGWAVGEYHGHRSVGHGGGIPGFMTYAERFPEDDLAMIVLTNSASSNPAEIARDVVGHYILTSSHPLDAAD